MILLPLTEELVAQVARRMRAEDAREVYATRRSADPDAFAAECAALSRLGAVAATDDGEPAAALGVWEAWPGMWSVWMVATDAWPRVALGVTRWAKRTLAPAIAATSAHRLECRTIEGHAGAQRWLEALGARREASLAGYGKNGETFHVYVWRRDPPRAGRPTHDPSGVIPVARRKECQSHVRKPAQPVQAAGAAEAGEAAAARRCSGGGRRAGRAPARQPGARRGVDHPDRRPGRHLGRADRHEAVARAVIFNAALTAAPPTPFARRPHPDLPPLARGKEPSAGEGA